jgi:DNA invertase Pin-like site-specific DNA recombinase
MKIGYARVSTDDQRSALQHDALMAAGCRRVFEDRITGAVFKRKGLTRALRALKRGDELVVWKLDRLGRSMLETITIVLQLDRRGIAFRSLTESFDTKTAIGRGVLAFIAAVAEDERERIRERTRAGLAAARKRGSRLGRPPKLSPEKIAQARAMLPGHTRREIAAKLQVNVGTLRRGLRGERSDLLQ